MKSYAISLSVVALFLPVVLTARPKIDTVVMTNGDRITCEVEKLERGVLYASLDYVDGVVSINWSKVARVESVQLFIVHTKDGSVYSGTIQSAGTAAQQPVKIEILETPHSSRILDRPQVVEMAQSTEKFWRRLSGNIDFGLLFTKGNDTTQYSVGADLRIRRKNWRVAADYTSTFSKASGSPSATRNQPRVWARRLVGGKRKWYYTAGAEFLQSSAQGINLQTSLGGGFGRFVKDTNSVRLAFTAGTALQHTKYEPSSGVQSVPNAFAGMLNTDLHLFRFKRTAFDITASVLPAMTEAGRVRAYVNSGYKIQAVTNLWFKLSFYGNWDNRPPANFPGSDYGASSSISYSFN